MNVVSYLVVTRERRRLAIFFCLRRRQAASEPTSRVFVDVFPFPLSNILE